MVGEAGLEAGARTRTRRTNGSKVWKTTHHKPTLCRRGTQNTVSQGLQTAVPLSNGIPIVDQLANLVSGLSCGRRQNVAVNVHGCGDVFMTESFLSHLHINTL